MTLPDLYLNIGEAYSKQGDLGAAKACYEEALRINPEHANTHNNLGGIHYSQGNFKAAKACWEKTLQINTEDAVAQHNLAIVNRELDRRR